MTDLREIFLDTRTIAVSSSTVFNYTATSTPGRRSVLHSIMIKFPQDYTGTIRVTKVNTSNTYYNHYIINEAVTSTAHFLKKDLNILCSNINSIQLATVSTCSSTNASVYMELGYFNNAY